ncbi:hypothetical protein H6503_04960 [Candidatus Woesearchaeota archaeon]|nr:hypothetical protein [Candidatus Woesearchaeota archaeon]
MDLTKYPDTCEPLCFNSMLEGLLNSTTYHLNQIDSVSAMCHDQEKTREYLLMPDIRNLVSRFGLEIFGYGSRIGSDDDLASVIWIPTPERLTEHYTIIKMSDGSKFMWYEPFQETFQGNSTFWTKLFGEENRPLQGGFLLQIKDDNESFHDLQRRFDGYRTGSLYSVE